MATIPSIAMIPSGYKANKVYSVLPTDGSGDLDSARTSTATRVNSEGLIETVLTGVPRLDYTDGSCPSLLLEPSSTNLITQSESFGNSYWAKSGASIEGDASTAGSDLLSGWDFTVGWVAHSGGEVVDANSFNSNGGGYTGIKKNTLVEVGKTYLIQIAGTVASGDFLFGNYNGTSISKQLTGTFNSTFYYTASDAGFLLRNTLANIQTDITTFSIKEVQGFSAPSVDSPLGAFKLVEDSANALHLSAGDLLTVVNSSNNTMSIYAKSSGRNLAIRETATTGDYACFDLVNGTVFEQTGVSANITLISDEWYRLDLTFLAGSTSAKFQIILLDSSYISGSPVVTYQGDGTSGVYIFASQLEQQSSATSYIPTAGTTISRTADSASKSGISSFIGQTEGVLYAEISALADDSTIRAISLSDGTNSNFISIQYSNASNRLIFSTSVATFMQTFSYDITYNLKLAFKYKENDFAMWVNGVEVVVDALGGLPSNLSELAFDRGDGGSPFYGKVKDLRVYKTALTDSELTTLTTI